MSITFEDSRLGPGQLKLGTADYAVQLSNIRLVPTYNSTDGVKTLGDPNPTAEDEETWALAGTTIQDWGATAGFVKYCFDQAGNEVTFEFVPESSGTLKLSGTVKVRAVEIGGDAGTQLTSDFEFSCKGKPTWGTHTPAAQSNPAPATR